MYDSVSTSMLTPSAKEELERQQYRVVGNHSAVKVCGWTKNMIRGEGGCYKLKFYGIMSNQCMQMTTSISCANRCTFCWRGYKAPVSKEWKWAVDDPIEIVTESKEAHQSLLNGFGGSPTANKAMYEKAKTVKHVALSLTGEPIFYPRINEAIEEFNRQGISTFLVTNAQYPEQMRDLKPVTQLYISIDAPTKEALKHVDKPLFKDNWERLMQSLDYMKEKKQRTCIRLTMIKGINNLDFDKYAELIKRADSDFVEIKGYMFVGASTSRLKRENMPLHEEVVEYAKELEKHISGYEIVTDHPQSCVVMLAKKTFKKDGKWHTWIDFEKYHELVTSGVEFSAEDYLKITPRPGLSGKKSSDFVSRRHRKRMAKKKMLEEATGEVSEMNL